MRGRIFKWKSNHNDSLFTGPADAKRIAIYDRECLELVYDPNAIYLYGIPPTALEHREKQCLYCGKPLPLPKLPSTFSTSTFYVDPFMQIGVNCIKKAGRFAAEIMQK